jgi:hypothetical protein
VREARKLADASGVRAVIDHADKHEQHSGDQPMREHPH